MSLLLDGVQQAMEASELVSAVGAIVANDTSLLWGAGLRALTLEELDRLQAQGNQAADWSQVQVSRDFRPESVWRNHFLGRVVLGRFSGQSHEVAGLPTGVYESTLQDVRIADEAVVYRVGLLNRTVVHQRAVVARCSSVTSCGDTTFGCGEALPLAIEMGGREVSIYAEMTVAVAARLARSTSDQRLQVHYRRAVEDYLEKVRCQWSIIGPDAVVQDNGRIADTYIGPSAVVENARLVAESSLLSSGDDPVRVSDGALLRGAVVQWGSCIDSMALVDRSVLCEHALVHRHAKVTQSIIGPDTVIGAGEVTASLVGPNVGFGHQALLIAAMWPAGKGNVGYGANIGSNHTGRAPDQEIWCGEGTFFGLAVNIKFPANLSGSPYSIIGAGATCLPQRVEFPFSLINSPSAHDHHVPTSFNEICPGWVLAENIYMIRRNEFKLPQRSKARRQSSDFTVFREEIIHMMDQARQRLVDVGPGTFYTEAEIPGLGKNYLTESGRLVGIDAYDFYIKWYALDGLRRRLGQLGVDASSREAADAITQRSPEPVWEYARQILVEEFDAMDATSMLKDLVERERRIAQEVERTRARDDSRGARIIPDYLDAHVSAEADGFVQQSWQRFWELEAQVRRMLGGV